jgi:hypothetical protein
VIGAGAAWIFSRAKLLNFFGGQARVARAANLMGSLRPFSAFPHRTPVELPIAISMDKTGIANTQQSLQFLDCLGDHAARLVGLELILQLNENLISAV